MIKMSELAAAVLAPRSEMVPALQAIVPGEGVIEAERERRAFERASLIAYRQLLMAGHYGPRVAGQDVIPARSQEAKTENVTAASRLDSSKPDSCFMPQRS